jgi:ADP-ribosylglycohydrolase
MERALLSLRGLAVGDAFGDQLFCSPAMIETFLAERAIPAPPWFWTDDTAMAHGVVEVLAAHGRADPDATRPTAIPAAASGGRARSPTMPPSGSR